jgi:hypothetical protein
MSITENEYSLKNQLNKADPNTLPDMFRVVQLGDVLRAIPTSLRKKTPAADAGVLATLQSIVLAEDAKANTIFRAYARTATAGAGELTVVGPNVTPTSGQISVAPNRDIVVLAADAITELDIVYLPEKCDIIELTFPVVSNTMTLPASVTSLGVIAMLEATAIVGTIPGKKIILAPAGSAPATGQARTNVARSTIAFNGTDAVTSATVKLAVSAAVNLDALLTATSTIA